MLQSINEDICKNYKLMKFSQDLVYCRLDEINYSIIASLDSFSHPNIYKMIDQQQYM